MACALFSVQTGAEVLSCYFLLWRTCLQADVSSYLTAFEATLRSSYLPAKDFAREVINRGPEELSTGDDILSVGTEQPISNHAFHHLQ